MAQDGQKLRNFYLRNATSYRNYDYFEDGVYTLTVAYILNNQISPGVTARIRVGEINLEAETLTLPDDTNRIEAEAFAGFSAARVVLPVGCTVVGEKAFANNDLLEIVVVPGMNTVIAENAFDGCGEITIQTVSGSKAEQTFANMAGVTIEHID